MSDRALVISPHPSDAALSRGGGIAQLVGVGIRVTIVTVFTADAPADERLSLLARRCHRSRPSLVPDPHLCMAD